MRLHGCRRRKGFTSDSKFFSFPILLVTVLILLFTVRYRTSQTQEIEIESGSRDWKLLLVGKAGKQFQRRKS